MSNIAGILQASSAVGAFGSMTNFAKAVCQYLPEPSVLKEDLFTKTCAQIGVIKHGTQGIELRGDSNNVGIGLIRKNLI
jgi:hypothetical protein